MFGSVLGYTKNSYIKIASFTLALVAMLAGFFVLPHTSFGAAQISLEPAAALMDVGQEIEVTVRVDTDGNAINAASVNVTFDPFVYEVISVDTSQSILSVWAQGPIYSNVLGYIRGQGILLGDSYVGNDGSIMTIRFKAKQRQYSPITLVSGSILAADGQGTTIASLLTDTEINPQLNPALENAITKNEIVETTVSVSPTENSVSTDTNSNDTSSVPVSENAVDESYSLNDAAESSINQSHVSDILNDHNMDNSLKETPESGLSVFSGSHLDQTSESGTLSYKSDKGHYLNLGHDFERVSIFLRWVVFGMVLSLIIIILLMLIIYLNDKRHREQQRDFDAVHKIKN